MTTRTLVEFPTVYGTPSPYRYEVGFDLDVVERRVKRELDFINGNIINGGSFNGQPILLSGNFGGPSVVRMALSIITTPAVLAAEADNGFNGLDRLSHVVRTWTERARVTGIRGDRFHAFELYAPGEASIFNFFDGDDEAIDPYHIEKMLRDDDDCGYETVRLDAKLLLGTMIFYNHQRATAGFHAEPEHVGMDLNNLVEHVERIDSDATFILDHSLHGVINYG